MGVGWQIGCFILLVERVSMATMYPPPPPLTSLSHPLPGMHGYESVQTSGLPTLLLPFIPSQRPSSGRLREALTVPSPPPLPPSGSQGGGPLDCQGFQVPGDPPHKSSSPQILALLTRMGDRHLLGMATPPLAGEKDWEELTETVQEWEGLTERGYRL